MPSPAGFRSVQRAAALVAALAVLGCPTPAPEPLPDLPAPLLQIGRDYWVAGEGVVRIGEVEVPGTLRMSYTVRPDGSVTIPHFVTWFEDTDLVITFLWWEVEREPLRCAAVRNGEPLAATLANGELVIPADAALIGQAFSERDAEGRCGGPLRRLRGTPGAPVRAVHDPENDRFALSASFDTELDGNELTIALELEGHYLNRPPIAALEANGDGVAVAADGCPVTSKGKPPIAVANSVDGLLVTLRSTSWDPDGTWPAAVTPKRPRVDLAFEQWARRESGRWEFIGDGREVGPLLFATGREHELLLWITDRHGAEARALCHFQVVAAR